MTPTPTGRAGARAGIPPLLAAITLLGETTAGDALARLRLVSPDAYVVINRERGSDRYWYVRRADELRQELETSDPARWVSLVLDLHEWQAAPAVEIDEPDPVGPVDVPSVLLHGDRVLGVLAPAQPVGDRARPRGPLLRADPEEPAGSGTAGYGRPPSGGGGVAGASGWGGAPPSYGSAGAPRGRVRPARRLRGPGAHGGTRRGLRDFLGGAGQEVSRAGREVVGELGRWFRPVGTRPDLPDSDRDGLSDPTGSDAAPGEGPGTSEDFRAHPRLDAPAAVQAGVPFVLEVGLSSDAVAAASSAGPIVVSAASLRDDAEVVFVVQAFGAGLSFPKGIRRTLTVPRDDPEAAVVRFQVVADPVPVDVPRIVEVSYEFAGNVCGRAWRQVMVGAHDLPVAPAPQAGGGGIAAPVTEDTPDLTVEIRAKDGDSELEWLFHSRYDDLPLPTHKVVTSLRQLDARTFAMEVMSTLPETEGTAALAAAVRGVGRSVLTAIPEVFWQVLDATWRRARARGVVPSLLLVTEDPYVPWELASLEDDRFVDPALLSGTDTTVAVLGALWRVGRWFPPVVSSPRGGDLPPLPPATEVAVSAMAVVVGDYASDSDWRPLPKAVEEGGLIAQRYGAVRLTAEEQQLLRLLSGDFEDQGRPLRPEAVHFACHGEVDLSDPTLTGIILNDGELRLTPLILRGTSLGRSAQPFVFLNACEVGAAGTVLSEYGGMAGAFLVEGCRAFLAPLWVVDDAVARDVALSFYRYTLEEGLPVAEAMRRVRATFGGDAAHGTSTPLAYTFYGHPSLRLTRTGTPALESSP